MTAATSAPIGDRAERSSGSLAHRGCFGQWWLAWAHRAASHGECPVEVAKLPTFDPGIHQLDLLRPQAGDGEAVLEVQLDQSLLGQSM